MKPLRLHVELTTPGFLGGADPSQDCEWRAASVRGQLRWWFRAVAGGRFQGDLEEVRNAGIEVFGSTDRGSALRVRLAGKGRVLEGRECGSWGERVDSVRLGKIWKIGEGEEPQEETKGRLRLGSAVNPVHYLAGQGCIRSNALARPCLEAESPAELSIRLRPGRRLGAPALAVLDKAIWAWLHLGGLGTRSRRGFGSLVVTGNEGGDGFEPATSREELVSGVRSLLVLGKESTGLAEWSHLSSRTRVCLAKETFESWDDAMVHAGGWMMAFRRRYGISENQNEQRDYHWAKQAAHGEPKGVPDRGGFGLPLPFSKAIVSPVKENRRASPLLLHVAKLGDRYRPVWTHLPARLVPDGHSIGFERRRRSASPPTEEQTEIVTRFLDDLIAKDLLETVEP